MIDNVGLWEILEYYLPICLQCLRRACGKSPIVEVQWLSQGPGQDNTEGYQKDRNL